MKKLSPSFLLILFLLIGFLSCSNENQESNTTILQIEETEFLNVSYGTSSEQVYDIYLPANRDLNTKVLILVHGGGWTSGDKAEMTPYKNIANEELAEYAIVNINYRLASQGVSPFPMQLNDISAVINHLKTKQLDYKISKDYGFIGVSAGAHLSMLWSYNYDTENDIDMVISIVGPTNFTDPAYADFITPAFTYFGETPTDAILQLYSPYHHVSVSSPPTSLFYGGMDPLIPTSQGVDMDIKLTEMNVAHEFTLYPNEGHGWVGANLFDTWEKIKSFIITHH